MVIYLGTRVNVWLCCVHGNSPRNVSRISGHSNIWGVFGYLPPHKGVVLVNQNKAYNHRFTLIFLVPLILSQITRQSPPSESCQNLYGQPCTLYFLDRGQALTGYPKLDSLVLIIENLVSMRKFSIEHCKNTEKINKLTIWANARVKLYSQVHFASENNLG